MSLLSASGNVNILEDKDPYWNNVVSLLHFDGIDNSTQFDDEVYGTTWSIDTGTPKISSSEKMFGESSGYFARQPTSIVCNQSEVGNFENEDFTIELWIYPLSIPTTSNNYGFPITKDYAGSNQRGWQISLNGDYGGINLEECLLMDWLVHVIVYNH